MKVLRVNMIPASASGETYQDSEPFLAVSPANPNIIVATAFTPDPAGGPTAPVYVSRDRGRTWSLWSTVPGATGDSPVADITIAFDGTGSDLYLALIRADSVIRERLIATTTILRTNDVSSMAPPTTTFSQPSETPRVFDQPVVNATTSPSGMEAGQDRVYLAYNDINSFPGATAKVLFSTDAANPTPAFNFVTLDTRTAVQDASCVRSAPHQDGTVYAAFLGFRNIVTETGVISTDVVVTRDDNWGRGNAASPPFQSLIDPRDGLAGQRVATNVSLADDRIGQERVGFSLAIAVDPRNSRTVYIAWLDKQAGRQTLHVRRSGDGGQTWGDADLLTFANATNPGLAINSLGELGLMYQQLTGVEPAQRWETHVRLLLARRIWDGIRFVNDRDLTLASTPAAMPVRRFLPYLGDYLGFVSVGRDFYGVFSAGNIPDLANFPAYNEHTGEGSGGPHHVLYQRNADFTRRVLLNVDRRDTVAPSIDPFFVSISFSDEFRRIGVGAITAQHSACGEAPLADTSVSFAVRAEVHQPWWRESELVTVTYRWSLTAGTPESPTNTNSSYQVRMPPVQPDGSVGAVEVSVNVEIRVGDSAPRNYERRMRIQPITPEQAQFSCLLHTITTLIYQFLLLLLPPFRHVGPFPDPPPFLEQTIPGNFTGALLQGYQRVIKRFR